jgi:hypothetical protein
MWEICAGCTMHKLYPFPLISISPHTPIFTIIIFWLLTSVNMLYKKQYVVQGVAVVHRGYASSFSNRLTNVGLHAHTPAPS